MTNKQDHEMLIAIVGSAVVALSAYFLLPPKSAAQSEVEDPTTTELQPGPVPVESEPEDVPTLDTIPTIANNGKKVAYNPSPAPNALDFSKFLKALANPDPINLGNTTLPMVNLTLPTPALSTIAPGECSSCGPSSALKNYAPSQARLIGSPVVAAGLYAKITGNPALALPSSTSHGTPVLSKNGKYSFGQVLDSTGKPLNLSGYL